MPWQCISGCGACCRLDPAQRGQDLDCLSDEQRAQYLEMVGPDGWCVHFDTGARRCRIYSERPDFCRVENLVGLFLHQTDGDPSLTARGISSTAGNRQAQQPPPEEGNPDLDPEAQALAIACCRTQIRAEYGGRGRVMRRFERAIRRQP